MPTSSPTLSRIITEVARRQNEAPDWLIPSLVELRNLTSIPLGTDRLRRVTGVANELVLELRDHGLSSERISAEVRARGALLLYILIDGRLRALGPLSPTILDVLACLSDNLILVDSLGWSRCLLDAICTISADSALVELADQVIGSGFPLPLDQYFLRELPRAGFPVLGYQLGGSSPIPGECERRRLRKQSLLLLGRLISWSDAYPIWSVQIPESGEIQVWGVESGDQLRETHSIRRVEGRDVSTDPEAAYSVARSLVLQGEKFCIETDRGSEPVIISPRDEMKQRAQVFPESLLVQA